MIITSMEQFESNCKSLVAKYFNDHCEKTDNASITEEDVYSVWHVKALQNFKGLYSTNVTDGMYYEITYNGDTDEIYFDAYKKWENKCIKLKIYNTLHA